MASRFSDSWRSSGKKLNHHSAKKREDDLIACHIPTTKPPKTNQLNKYKTQPDGWLQGLGLQSSPKKKDRLPWRTFLSGWTQCLLTQTGRGRQQACCLSGVASPFFMRSMRPQTPGSRKEFPAPNITLTHKDKTQGEYSDLLLLSFTTKERRRVFLRI